MNVFEAKDIPVGGHFSRPVLLDDKFVLAASGVPFGKPLVDALAEWDFAQIHSDGEVSAPQSIRPEAPSGERQAQRREAPVPAPGGPARNTGRLLEARRFHISFEQFVRTILDRVSAQQNLDFNYIVRNFKPLLDNVRRNFQYILQVRPQAKQERDYLVFHTMDTVVVSVIVGDTMRMSDQWLMELAIASMLHDVGMLKLPMESYFVSRPLLDDEKKLIYVHPIASHNLLKALDFPPTVTRAVLEHHERENGTGYPNQKPAEGIHLYSKIIAVACSYAAISADRPHKPAQDAHAGIMELLENRDGQYNEKVIHALIASLSIFPIGLHVVLSDGRKAQVVEVNHGSPHRPVVRLLGAQNPDGTPAIVRTSDRAYIVRTLSPREAGE